MSAVTILNTIRSAILDLTIEFAAFTSRYYTTRKPYAIANSFYLTSPTNIPNYTLSPDYVGYGIYDDVVLNNIDILAGTHFDETYKFFVVIKRVVSNVETTILAFESNDEVYLSNVFKRSSYNGIGFQLLSGDRLFITTQRTASSEGNTATAIDVNIKLY